MEAFSGWRRCRPVRISPASDNGQAGDDCPVLGGRWFVGFLRSTMAPTQETYNGVGEMSAISPVLSGRAES